MDRRCSGGVNCCCVNAQPALFSCWSCSPSTSLSCSCPLSVTLMWFPVIPCSFTATHWKLKIKGGVGLGMGLKRCHRQSSSFYFYSTEPEYNNCLTPPASQSAINWSHSAQSLFLYLWDWKLSMLYSDWLMFACRALAIALAIAWVYFMWRKEVPEDARRPKAKRCCLVGIGVACMQGSRGHWNANSLMSRAVVV